MCRQKDLRTSDAAGALLLVKAYLVVEFLDLKKYSETSDELRHEFERREALTQNNNDVSPADKIPLRCSGMERDEVCQQMVAKLSRPPRVHNKRPFLSSQRVKE